MEHTLIITDWHPVRTNEWAGRHWAVKGKLRGGQESMIRVYAMQQSIRLASGKRAVKLLLHGWPTGKFPDRDAYDKLLLDALVNTGLLINDDGKGLEGRVEVEFVRSKERRTTIILRDCGTDSHPTEAQCSA